MVRSATMCPATSGMVESGSVGLAPAAIEAVKQWKYKPYLLNGEPVEVVTTIDVVFTLSS